MKNEINMAKIHPHTTIEDGMIMGKVSTNILGSECQFPVCPLSDYEKMTEEEAYEALEQAMWESGYCNVNF